MEHKTPGQQTDSHASQQLGTSSEKLSTSKENIAAFIDAWKNYDRAGSHLVSSMCNDLSGSQLEGVEGLLGSSLSMALFSGSGSEQALGHLKEFENTLSSPKPQDHRAKPDLSQVSDGL